MNVFELVKFNLIDRFKKISTYIGFLLVLLFPILYVISQIKYHQSVDGHVIAILGQWTFGFLGLMLIIATLVRDSSQGTIQLYLNSKENRIKYFISQFISIIIIGLITSIILIIATLILQSTAKGPHLPSDEIGHIICIHISLFMFYGLFLFLIILLFKSSALSFSLGVFIMLIIPIATNLIPLVPKYGSIIEKILKYVPFNFLVSKLWSGELALNHWQLIITIASIILLIMIDLFVITKKDY